MKKQLFFMISLLFAAFMVSAQSAQINSPDQDNQETTTELNDENQKNGDDIGPVAYRYNSSDVYQENGTPQGMIDNAEDGDKIVIYYNNNVKAAPPSGLELDVNDEITIVHDFVNNPPAEPGPTK